MGHQERNLLGIAGVFLTAGRLSLKNCIALTTSRNTGSYDIVALNPDNNHAMGIQVKTTKENAGIEKDSFLILGVTEKNLKDEVDKKILCPYVFVYINKQDTQRFFIVPAKEVKNMVKQAWENYINNSKHRKPVEDIKKTIQPMAISVKQLLAYEDKWENILKELK